MKEAVNIVWFKRDLRVKDHLPLYSAVESGKVLPLYIVEPEYWSLPDTSSRQYQFIKQSLIELDARLERLGQPLQVRVGDAVDVFNTLATQFDITGIYSHEETGNLWTYERDKSVMNWCKAQSIDWLEAPQFGVFRRFSSRDHWASRWEQFMCQVRTPAPKALVPLDTALDTEELPALLGSVLESDEAEYTQQGGRSQGLHLLKSFLSSRAQYYQSRLSSPLTAFEYCSRLSPHISYGTLSMREVVHSLRNRREGAELSAYWKRSIRAFESRLHWHCHFIQKLETSPNFEVEPMVACYAPLRQTEGEFNEEYFEAWRMGQTGFPLIDACMRALRHTGWINFRMRAMLVSFSSYQLWLHWQRPAWHLAQCFTDYEPGIHYPQIQMQSGTTGINALRMYNPVKQSQDQDPKGQFIRRWVPELLNVSDEYIHEPWKLPLSLQREFGCELGVNYPEPIVDHMTAVRLARARLKAFKDSVPELREQSKALNKQHGSRRKMNRKPKTAKSRKSKKSTVDENQLSLF